MSKHPSKSHVPSPENALQAEFEADSAKAHEVFKNGKETLLDAKRMVCHDGSVWDCFHHIATDALHGATKHASE
jgi:hypothetical protein